LRYQLIHKKGNRCNASNENGISLTNVVEN